MWLRLSGHPVDVVKVTLPMPPDYKFSFSGSGLPFANEESAFNPSQVPVYLNLESGTPDTVVLPTLTPEPNFYYRGGAYVAPRARAQYVSGGNAVDEMVPIHGVRRIPSRSLTPAPRLFASSRAGPVVTQESMLRSTAMPSPLCLLKSAPDPRLAHA